MNPLWRIVTMPNFAKYYGPEDGTYGTEAPIRKEYAALIKAGKQARIEHRESVNHLWRIDRPTRNNSQPLFRDLDAAS